MKRHEAQTFGQIFAQLIDSTGSRDTFEQQRVCYLWPEIVGPTINRHTMRRWVEGTTLHVAITSAVLKSELGMMRTALVERLNAAAGKNIITTLQIH